MRPILSAVLALALLTAGPAGGAAKPEITVFAAASLADAFKEVASAFAAAGGARVVFNFAASNDLARQIEAGAAAQVFVSANREQVERLEKAGRVRPGTAFPLLGNTLVVIVSAGSKTGSLSAPRDLLGFDRLALADPAGVPAGIYAREWLERAQVWEQLAPRVVPTLDVRAALAAVAAGNLPAGVVYATDAASSDRVRIVYRVPAADAPQVRYIAAPVAGAPKAAGFLAFLRGPRARQIFLRHGFAPLASGAAKPGG